MQYLIKFDESGKRQETYVADEKKEQERESLLQDGFILVDEDEYQKIIGNIDGKTYIRNPETGEYEAYEPPLEDLKSAKMAAVNAWTAAKITGGFTSDATGEAVTYDSDKDTQLTMQGIAATAGTDLFAQKYPDGVAVRGYAQTSNKKQVYTLTAGQVQAWCADLSKHINDCKQAGWAKQAAVEAAESKEDLDAITLT
ncbi:DUF4376 domain-containing protein [uncultured Megasphaera sp.]|uniref:DUF4376 domain-containing protein n=1 Tax=uncultured Megasphaera sp. TaxID=165188 RepID=UPI00266DB093|nr:DUF4376 domain-containing protein [uncultured Megasphaera sp.]